MRTLNRLGGIVLGLLVPAVGIGSATSTNLEDSPHRKMGNPTHASADRRDHLTRDPPAPVQSPPRASS
jgi:hypothetical protein